METLLLAIGAAILAYLIVYFTENKTATTEGSHLPPPGTPGYRNHSSNKSMATFFTWLVYFIVILAITLISYYGYNNKSRKPGISKISGTRTHITLSASKQDEYRL